MNWPHLGVDPIGAGMASHSNLASGLWLTTSGRHRMRRQFPSKPTTQARSRHAFILTELDWRKHSGGALQKNDAILEGYLLLFFFCGKFCFFLVPGSMLSCFSDFLLFCFSAFLLLCLHCFSAFPASLLFCFLLSLLLCFSCFSAFRLFAFLLLCFSASLFSLLLCLCTSVPFYFYYSTFSFLQSCVFAALLPAPLLLCFLSLLSLCFSFHSALFCSVCILNETLERP